MKITTLEYFIAMAEYRSINKAAQALFVAQPSLTKALQAFEKEIGTQLFYRDKSGISLTEAGAKILPEAKEIVRYYNGWKDLSSLDSVKQIDIYAQSAFVHFFLPDILLRFKKAYSSVHITLNSVLKPGEFISRDIHQPVMALAICNEELKGQYTKLQGNEPVKLMDCEFRYLMNRDNPLSEQGSLSMDEVRDLYFVMAHLKGTKENDGFLYKMFKELFDKLPEDHAMEVESLPNAVSLIGKDKELFTITNYPLISRVNPLLNEKLITVPLKGREIKNPACLFYSETAYKQHPAMRELVKDIREAAKELSGI